MMDQRLVNKAARIARNRAYTAESKSRKKAEKLGVKMPSYCKAKPLDHVDGACCDVLGLDRVRIDPMVLAILSPERDEDQERLEQLARAVRAKLKGTKPSR